MHNSQNKETIQMPISGLMDKGNVVYTHHGILFRLKKKEIVSFVTTWMDLEDIMLSKLSQPQ